MRKLLFSSYNRFFSVFGLVLLLCISGCGKTSPIIRTSFAWWIPLLSIVLILILCALTLWYQVWKATRIKPYKVLKEN